MLKIGMTGGIGCGKTMVAERFEKKGVEIIDADQISHSLTQPHSPGLAKIVKHFGTSVLDAEGKLDRAALREIVFDAPQEREQLEAILHPMVFEGIADRAVKASGSYCLICVPLLLETGRSADFDRILVVDCPVEVQIQRTQKRDRVDELQIRRIIQSQSGRKEKLKAANDVIVNNGDLSLLDNQVEKLHNFYLDLAKITGS
jgi:dephospho-CoA kinase